MTVVVVSWILVLLSLLCLSFSHETRMDMHLAHRETDAVISRALARSGVAVAQSVLASTASNSWDAAIEGWDQNPALQEVRLGDGSFSVGHAADPGEAARTTYGIEDEERRIPIQSLDRQILARLPGMTAEGVDSVLVAVAARDPDLGPEIELPMNLDVSSRAAIERYVTTYEGGININTASREVLLALRIPAEAAEKIVGRRDGPDHRPGTVDDLPFTSVVLAEGGLDECALNAEEAAAVSSLARSGLLTTWSSHFRVRARGWIEGRNDYYEIDALLHRSSAGHVDIVEWGEKWAR